MVSNRVTLMINSTFYDMMAEYNCFINEVFPKLRDECLKHDIELVYREVAFSVPKEDSDDGIILQDFRFIDMDRTFFICFRAQRLGWRPTHLNINEMTIDEYPELVGYIGNMSITELAIMHALVPFERYVDGVKCDLKPAKHSLFYFRKHDFLDDLNEDEKSFYINKTNGELKEVQDIEVAKCKDLICETKHAFDKDPNNQCRMIIRNYDVGFHREMNNFQMFLDYLGKYSSLAGRNLDEFVEIHERYFCKDKGALADLTFEGRPLGEVMYEDILNELKLEFPQNF
jgi:hypothetical protein